MIYILILLLFLIIFFQGRGIPAILYHQINEYSNVDKDLFEEHIKFLSKSGYKSITVREYVEGDYSKKDKLIMLTFDDGYYDNYLNMFPILKKYNMKATIFLNSFYMKDEERGIKNKVIESREANKQAMLSFVEGGDAKTWQYLTWQEVKEMHGSDLVDFQAHSHKHTPIVTDIKLEGIRKSEESDSSDIYVYGREGRSGDPIFRKRGECSQKGWRIEREFFDLFNDEYKANIEGKEAELELAQSFVDSYIGKLIFEETEEEAFERIAKEGLINKKEIEDRLGYEVTSFCWPWGHSSELGIKALKSVGYKAFITTKKGSNSLSGNIEKVRRVELRSFTLKKFILNVRLNRNLILGRLYELVS